MRKPIQSRSEQDPLPPKPPETLQKLKWLLLHGRRYWPYLAVGCFLAITALLVQSPKQFLALFSQSPVSVSPSASDQPTAPIPSNDTALNTELTAFFDQLSANMRSENWESVSKAYHPAFTGKALNGVYRRDVEVLRARATGDLSLKFNGIRRKDSDGSILVYSRANSRGDLRDEEYRMVKEGNSWFIAERLTGGRNQ